MVHRRINAGVPRFPPGARPFCPRRRSAKPTRPSPSHFGVERSAVPHTHIELLLWISMLISASACMCFRLCYQKPVPSSTVRTCVGDKIRPCPGAEGHRVGHQSRPRCMHHLRGFEVMTGGRKACVNWQ